MTKHLEIKTIEHKGIKVMVKVDYDEGEVSLVESLNANGSNQYPSKKWVFGGRGLEYMNSWISILEAMTMAIKDGKKDLEQDLAEKTKFKDKQIINLVKNSAKVVYAKK